MSHYLEADVLVKMDPQRTLGTVDNLFHFPGEPAFPFAVERQVQNVGLVEQGVQPSRQIGFVFSDQIRSS